MFAKYVMNKRCSCGKTANSRFSGLKEFQEKVLESDQCLSA